MPGGDNGLGNPAEPPPSTTSFPHRVAPPPPNGGRRGVNEEEEELKLDLASHRLAFVELASLVVLFSAVAYGLGSSLSYYALSVGVVSFVLCIGMRVADHVKPDSLDTVVTRSTDPRIRRAVTAMDLIGSILFFWWGFGAFFLTFRGPFLTTSNGYFGAWGGLAATVWWVHPNVKNISESVELNTKDMEGRNRAITGLLASALVVMLASIQFVRIPEGAWGLACGAVTIVVCIVLISVDREMIPFMFRRIITVVLVLMWIFAAGILTFKGPFVFTGNGYFGSWIGLLCSIWYAAYDVKEETSGE